MKLVYTWIATAMVAGAFMQQPALAVESTNASVKQDNPLQAVHDNFTLAEKLLAEKQYAAARNALIDAKKGLGDYNFLVHEPERKHHVEQMQKGIDALSEELRKEDPTTLQKAGDTVKGWGMTVGKWLIIVVKHSGIKP